MRLYLLRSSYFLDGVDDVFWLAFGVDGEVEDLQVRNDVELAKMIIR
jgi:hypothetical protein